MEDLQLHDLLEFFPETDDPLFAYKIHTLPLFEKYRLTKCEDIPPLYFKHQLFCRQFLDIYPSLFVYHLAGTGKTRVAKCIGEGFRLKKGRTQHIRRALILVKNKQLGVTFKEELYTGEDVLLGESIKETTPVPLDFYSVEIQSQFASKISKMSDKDVVHNYSYSFVFIDESQALTSLHMDGVSVDPVDKVSSVRKKKDIYEHIHRFIHLIKYSKVAISTASPMQNFSHELPRQLNLLPPLARNLPLDIDYDNKSIEEIEPYLRGRVSYVRNQENLIKTVYMTRLPMDKKSNKPLINTTLPLWCIPMVGKKKLSDGQILLGQKKAYLDVYTKNKGRDQLRTAELQASNFVFPDGTFGSKGFDSTWVNHENDEGCSTFVASKPLLNLMRDVLPSLSCKMDATRRLTTEIDGCSIVYVGYKNGSGAFLHGLTYEALLPPNRFVRFLGKSTSKLLPSDGVTVPYRYCILTSDIDGWQDILSISSSPENVNGRLIKVFLLTKIAREGISIAHARRIIVSSAAWNLSAIYQAVARGLRATSQDCLLEQERRRLVERGEDPANASVTVEVYQLAAYTFDDRSESNLISVDIDHYMKAESKETPIARLSKYLQMTAVDSFLNLERNRHSTDIEMIEPFSLSTDCSISTPLRLIDIPCIVNQIKEVMRCSLKTNLSFDELCQCLSDHDTRLVSLGLESIVSNPSTTLDRYGLDSYICFSNNMIYLQRTYPEECVHSYFNDGFYSSIIIGVEEKSIDDYILCTRVKMNVNAILTSNTTNESDVVSIIQSLSFNECIELLESSISSSRIVITNDVVEVEPINLVSQVSLQHFHHMIYELHSLPSSHFSPLRDSSKSLTSKQVKRCNDDGLPTRRLFHSMYHYQSGRSAYKTNSNVDRSYGRIRIYDKISSSSTCYKWRDTLSDEEHSSCRKIIQDVIREKKKSFEQYDVYGKIIFGSSTLKIRNKILEREEASSNARMARLGIACSSMNKKILVELMFSLGVERDNTFLSYKNVEMKRERLAELECKLDTDNLSDDQVVYYYKWLTGENSTKDKMCSVLKNWFIVNNRLLII